jgi:MFS family permease
VATVEQRRSLLLVALAAVLANSAWFSATAVAPELETDWHLSAAGSAWLVIVVQVGFVIGSVGAALLNLPDRVEPRRLIAASAVAAGSANLGLIAAPGLSWALPFRFLVGVALAGVYAPGVRLVATHFEHGRGVATGVVVGALTLGSATPHLVRGLGHVPWQATIAVTSVLAALAAVSVRPVRTGPASVATPPLDVGAAIRALVSQRPLRLATLGYLGHMWELYALWSWLSAFFVASRHTHAPSALETGTVTFLVIGVAGLIGAVAAGRYADRLGRTAVTSAAMVVSAACCLASPVAFASSEPILIGLLLVWGASVIADSAQFSAAVTELAEPSYAGSVLALQLALGFTLTIASIRLVPVAVDVVGWRYALLPLAVGPLAGTVAMLLLRRLPESLALANGRR